MKSEPRPLPDLITVSEAAASLRVTPMTIRRMVERGELPSTRVGPKIIRIPRTALNRFAGTEVSNAQ
jgi:excisionase family DNA binding protein